MRELTKPLPPSTKHSLMRAIVRFFVGLSLGLAFAVLPACGILEQDPTAKWDAERLYTEAKDEMSVGNWQHAREYLEKLEARYPFGQYAQQAQMEIVYTYYKEGETAQAVVAADRFLKLNPNHENADYAQYLKGLCLFAYEPGLLGSLFYQEPSRRDPKSMREAFDVFKELVQRWPESKYADDARARMNFLVASLAQSEINVARYYLKRGAYVAAISRAQGAIRDYQTTATTKDGLEIMVAAYRGLGLNDLAADSEKVLQLNYPAAGSGK